MSGLCCRPERIFFQKARQEGPPEYAQRLMSTPGNQDGLYWEAGSWGRAQSHGTALCRGQGRGVRRDATGKPSGPFGGDRSPTTAIFIGFSKPRGRRHPVGPGTMWKGGKRTGGFALIAYPARYCSSGVKSFIVNQDGIGLPKRPREEFPGRGARPEGVRSRSELGPGA